MYTDFNSEYNCGTFLFEFLNYDRWTPYTITKKRNRGTPWANLHNCAKYKILKNKLSFGNHFSIWGPSPEFNLGLAHNL